MLLSYFFKKEGRPVEDVDKFSLYILISCLVGARLGEVIFYDPIRYLKSPLEAILPIEFNPNLQVVGYRGLSYHGALIGGFVGAFLYANYDINFSLYPFRFKFVKQKKVGQSFLWLLTPLAFGVLMGLFVRIGNFVNSEIIGTPTHSHYGVLFAKHIIEDLSSKPAIQSVRIVKDNTAKYDSTKGYPPIILECAFLGINTEQKDIKSFVENRLNNYLRTSHIREHLYIPDDSTLDYTINRNKKSQYIVGIKAFGIPRHPVQLYESFSYMFTLLILFVWWNRRGTTIRDGAIAGIAAILSYSFRFLFEFFKNPFNVLIPGKYPVTMGHVLSLLTVVAGIIVLIIAYRVSDNKKIS
jgi:prolipoprotein diacylglyceryltransferase